MSYPITSSPNDLIFFITCSSCLSFIHQVLSFVPFSYISSMSLREKRRWLRSARTAGLMDWRRNSRQQVTLCLWQKTIKASQSILLLLVVLAVMLLINVVVFTTSYDFFLRYSRSFGTWTTWITWMHDPCIKTTWPGQNCSWIKMVMCPWITWETSIKIFSYKHSLTRPILQYAGTKKSGLSEVGS